MIIMTIAKLSGRRRQSPIVQGEEGQNCLGTKETLSMDTHRSHVYTNSVRYTVEPR